MSSISKCLESDFAGYRVSSHSLLFNFRLICPDSAAAGSALQSVIKSTKNGLEGWNCWELIWRKPNTQKISQDMTCQVYVQSHFCLRSSCLYYKYDLYSYLSKVPML